MRASLSCLLGAAVALTSLVACAPSVNDDPSPLGATADTLLRGHQLSATAAAALIRQAGFPEDKVGMLLCTIKYESNFFEGATNHNKNGTLDYGLFQINNTHLRERGCPSTTKALLDGETNAACALHVFNTQGINAWYGYRAHASECNAYPAPGAGTAGAEDPTTTTTMDPAPATPEPTTPTAPTPAPTPTPAGSCQYTCAAYGYTAGDCWSGYQCNDDGCLAYAAACEAAPPAGSGDTCQYPCSDYGYATGDCRSGYECESDGCLAYTPSCY